MSSPSPRPLPSAATALLLLLSAAPYQVFGQTKTWTPPVTSEVGWAQVDTLGSGPAPGLYRAISAVQLGSGLIAVVNQGSNDLGLYERGGRLVRTIGSEGDGPGEFQRIGQVAAWQPDTLVVFDRSHQRLTVLGEDGTVHWTSTYQMTSTRRLGGIVRLSGGRWISWTDETVLPVGPGEMRRDSMTFQVANVDRVVTLGETVAVTPGLISAALVIQGRVGVRDAAFSPTTVSTAIGRCLAIMATDDPTIRLLNSSGDRVGEIALPSRERTASATDLETWIDGLMTSASQGPEELLPAIRRALSDAPRPTTLPHFNSMFAADDGTIWVQRWAPPLGEGHEWWVVDPSLETIQRVTTKDPARGLGTTAGGDLIATVSDQRGVESLRILSRPPAIGGSTSRPLAADCG